MFPIKSLEDLEKISKEAKWQYFEKLAGWIFEQNDFEASVNRVIIFENDGEKRRRQYDIIAKRFDRMFLVECKKWSGGRYKTSALKEAAASHREKTDLFNDEYGTEAIPLMVTFMQEDITEHEGVKIVPMGKLNFFLNEQTF